MEIPIEKATSMFVGKTIAKMEVPGCNQIEFLFTDGSKAALHIDCNAMGLPDVLACSHCAEIDDAGLAHYEKEPLMNHPSRALLPIPISSAEAIAKKYGYDQVVILARRVGEEPQPRGEHVTTYGINKAHCDVAALMGDKLKQIANWPDVQTAAERIADLEAQIAEYEERDRDLALEERNEGR